MRHLNVSQAWPFPHLATAPPQVERLRLQVNDSLRDAAPGLLQSLLASKTFLRHSASSLVNIDAPQFMLSADSAAAFTELERIERLDAQSLPPNLPTSLRRLAIEGDEKTLTRLEPAVLSHLVELLSLSLFNVAVDVARLPDSVRTLDLCRCRNCVCGVLVSPHIISSDPTRSPTVRCIQ